MCPSVIVLWPWTCGNQIRMIPGWHNSTNRFPWDRCEDLFPLTRDPDLGPGSSNDESLVITEALNRQFLFIPPPPLGRF